MQPSMGSALLQLVLALALVCGLAVVLLRFGLRRFYPGGVRGGADLQLVARLALEPRRSVYLIEAGGRRFLVGAADSALTLLAELTPGAAPLPISAVASAAVPATTFAEVLQKAGPAPDPGEPR